MAPAHLGHGLPENPVLSDGRTTLRRFTSADAASFAAIHQDPLNIKWTGSVAGMGVRESAEMIAGSIQAGWDSGHYLRFAITDMLDGVDQIVGTLSLQDIFSTHDGGAAHVGIKMLPRGRGTGCAQRAIELLTGFAFGTLGLEVLHWITTVGNDSSAALARRCGFVQSAQIPGYGQVEGHVADGLVFSCSRERHASLLAVASPTLEVVPTAQAFELAPTVPVLRSATVTLRALRESDAPALVENCRDAAAVRWIPVPLNYSQADALHFINTVVPEGWRSGNTLTFAAVDPHSDRLLGTVDLQCNNPGAAAVGINFSKAARGTGTAEAAIRLLLDYAFDQLNLSFVHWHALAPNWGSRKLAWKLGFRFEGQIRGGYNDRGTPAELWVLSLAAGDDKAPQEPWAGPEPINR